MNLPSEKKKSLPSLPSTTQSYDQFISPVNGSSFATLTSENLVQFDLPSRGYLVPNSLYLKYTYAITQRVVGNTSNMIGTPVYSQFSRLELIVILQQNRL